MKQKLYYLLLIFIILLQILGGVYWYVHRLNSKIAVLEQAFYQHKVAIYAIVSAMCQGNKECATNFINQALGIQ